MDINSVKTDREALEFHKKYFRGKSKDENIKKIKKADLCRLYSIVYGGIKPKASYRKESIIREIEYALSFEETVNSMKL